MNAGETKKDTYKQKGQFRDIIMCMVDRLIAWELVSYASYLCRIYRLLLHAIDFFVIRTI